MHSRFWPQTRIGWVAALSFDAFMVLYIINGFMIKLTASSEWWLTSVLPYYGVLLMLTVVMASGGSVIALLFGRDQAWAVRMATLPIVVWVGVHMMIFVLNALHL
jgi:ABC-type Fe3+ transport system permease subunit